MSVIDSHANLMYSASNYGTVSRMGGYYLSAATTAATISSGFTTIQRYPFNLNIFGGTSSSPSLGAGVTGCYMTAFRANSEDVSCIYLCAIEYQMGQVTANGGTGTFSDGSALPSKTIRHAGTNNTVTIAPLKIFAYVSTTMVGSGTYTLTITYANQDGTGSRTATLTLPNVSAVNSTFDVTPHLQSGDTSITDVTNITLSGTSGVVRIMGLLPIGFSIGSTLDDFALYNDPLTNNLPMYPISNTDSIAIYRLGSNSTNNLLYHFTIVADY